MSQREKLIIKILCGSKDNDMSFDDVCNLLKYFGFAVRIKGSHHVFYREDVDEILNLQSKNGKAKPYQVKQVRNVIIKYKLGGNLDV